MLALLGCILAPACDSGPAADAGTEAARPIGTKIGYQAPSFSLPSLGAGTPTVLESYRGKVVLLSFWASWCGPCKVEIPELGEAWKHYENRDVVFLGISVDDSARIAEGFLRMFPVSFPMALDLDGGVSAQWGVESLPSSFLVDAQGVVRRHHIGYTPELLRVTLAEIDELLEEQGRR